MCLLFTDRLCLRVYIVYYVNMFIYLFFLSFSVLPFVSGLCIYRVFQLYMYNQRALIKTTFCVYAYVCVRARR